MDNFQFLISACFRNTVNSLNTSSLCLKNIGNLPTINMELPDICIDNIDFAIAL